jgi:erythromycin esterase
LHEPTLGDALFDVEQNARIVANAENYYRTMIHGNEDSWNVRDRHMHETLGLLLDWYGEDSKAIVWAHNTHIGDYRATDMVEHGQINLGGLARERWGENRVSLVGFGTFSGTVTAARAWDGGVETMELPPAKPGSYECAFHKAAGKLGAKDFFLDLQEVRDGPLAETRGHRAVGVVYHPQYEQFGNYVPTSLAQRYDAFLYLDQTTALNSLPQEFDRGLIPETWPQGL